MTHTFDCCSNTANHRYLYGKQSECPAYYDGTPEEIDSEMNLIICTTCGTSITNEGQL